MKMWSFQLRNSHYRDLHRHRYVLSFLCWMITGTEDWIDILNIVASELSYITHWSYVFLALTHQYVILILWILGILISDSLAFFSDCWGDGVEDQRDPSGLPSHRQPLVHPVLLHRWLAQHRPHVPVLSHVVHQPLHSLHSGEVSWLTGDKLEMTSIPSINGFCKTTFIDYDIDNQKIPPGASNAFYLLYIQCIGLRFWRDNLGVTSEVFKFSLIYNISLVGVRGCVRLNYLVIQCWKFSQKSCRSSCLESQIISMKLKKNQQKVPGPPSKLSASDRRTCGNFQHCGYRNSVL